MLIQHTHIVRLFSGESLLDFCKRKTQLALAAKQHQKREKRKKCNREYYIKNAKLNNAHRKKYKVANADTIKQQRMEYRKDHKDKIQQSNQNYYASRKDNCPKKANNNHNGQSASSQSSTVRSNPGVLNSNTSTELDDIDKFLKSQISDKELKKLLERIDKKYVHANTWNPRGV